MPKGLWIRLDVPYGEKACKMRAVLAYGGDENGPLKFAELNGLANVPEAVEAVYKKAAESGIELDSSLTLVYPLDDRHGIAWPAKEQAEKKGIQFSRHVPDILSLPPETATGYEDLDTGSPEDALGPEEAQKKVMELNAEAQENFASAGGLLEAMGPLRHALWLALRRFGWGCPGTVYTVRNLGYTLNATGNSDNLAEFLFLVSRMLYQWQLTPPQSAEWAGSETLIDTLAELCAKTGADEFAEMLKEARQKL